MKRRTALHKRAPRTSLIVSFLLLPFAILGQNLPEAALKEDFCILRKALEEAHGGIYRYTSKPEMDRTFDRAYRRIDRRMTDLEFWRLAAPLVAHIKCGHTFLLFPKTVQAQFETAIPLFPLEVRVLGGRAYVYQDYTNVRSPLEGSELLSINGVPLKKLLAQLRAVMTGDGNTVAVKAWRISRIGGFTVYLHGLGIESPFRVTYHASDGKRHSIELPRMTIPSARKHGKHATKSRQKPTLTSSF